MTLFLKSDADMTLAVGLNWSAASLFVRPALLRPRILLFARCDPSAYPVGVAKEVQDRHPKISEFPSAFHLVDRASARNTAKLCVLGSRLLRIQLRHPSPPLQLVGQVQLCVHYLSYV